MTNRTDKQKDDLLKVINGTWKLSIEEIGFLDYVLSLTKQRERVDNLHYLLESYVERDWSEILELIPDDDIETCAEYHLNMVHERDCAEEKTLDDFDDDEIEQEYFDRNNVGQRVDIVTNSQFGEMSDLFLSLDFISRENLLKQLRK